MTYVLFNDQLTTRKEVKIDMEDRGYNFGDGIYEVIPIYNGKIFSMEEHMQRFEESAKKLEMKLPSSISEISQLLTELKNKNKIKDGILYIQMTRGNSPRTHLYERNMKGILTGFSREVNFPVEQQRNGIHVFVTDDIRWLRCDIKTINLLGNTMVKRMAADNHCHEAIMHRQGVLTEGSSSNLFIIKDETIYTHPATNFILNGITRQIVIKLAQQTGYKLVEKSFTLAELDEADEAFITSTTQEITPIIQVCGDVRSSYKIGEITKTLQNLYSEYVKRHVLQ